jgi:hypothetical protein
MALEPIPPRELLPCGRDADTVAEHAAAGAPDDHERACPYCGEIITGSAAVDAAATELAQDTDTDPSPGLVPAVMQTVWSELRPGRRIPLPSGDGTTFATETAVISAITGELDLISDLTVRRIRLAAAAGPDQKGDPDAAGSAAAPDDPAALPAVTLSASARYPADIGALAAQARAAVVHCCQQLFGLTPQRVDIDITDLQLPVGTP